VSLRTSKLSPPIHIGSVTVCTCHTKIMMHSNCIETFPSSAVESTNCSTISDYRCVLELWWKLFHTATKKLHAPKPTVLVVVAVAHQLLFSLCIVKVEEVTLDDAADDTRRLREGDEVVCSRCAGRIVVRYRRQHAMPRLVVDVLSTTGELASGWFHHKKATPPEPTVLVLGVTRRWWPANHKCLLEH